MKRIMIALLISIFFSTEIYALEPNIVYQSNIYGNKVQGNITHYGKLGYIYMDGKIAYCLEPYKTIGSGYYSNPNYKNNFSTSDIQYFTLLSYYGYNTKNHNNIYYYMATQELIWRKITGQEIYWTTQNATKGDRINIESYKNEILNAVNNHNKVPSFGNQNIKGNFRDVIILEDKNKLLKNYTIKNSTPNIVWKEGNKLYVKLMSSKEQKVTLERKYSNNNPTTYYVANGGQAIANFSLNQTQSLILKLQATNRYSMKLKINFKDQNTKNDINGKVHFKVKNLENNTYIQDNTIFETDEHGHFISDFYVEEGKYQIETIDVPLNYVLNEGLSFEIIEDPTVETIEVDDYLKQAQGKIEINRTFDMQSINNTIINVPNVLYEIYAKENIYDENNQLIYAQNDLVEQLVTDENGVAISQYLPLGEYIVREKFDHDQITVDQESHHIKLAYKDNQTPLIQKQLQIQTKPDILDLNLHVKENDINCVDDQCKSKTTDLKNIEYGIYAEDDIYVENEKIVEKGEEIRKFKTDEHGNITEQIALLKGDYIVKELTDMSQYEEKFKDINFHFDKKNKLNVKLTKTKENIIKHNKRMLNTDNQYKEIYFISFINVLLSIMGILYVHKKS